ncbi:hypothetical protein [Candidatus Deianiraea vastatrix]|uniref:Uncharacterized protein n=1 Tax=Candidatus Deianiraea vastatrix TaxID=2163644 RepID=A0A5B8XF47_9RICK|nr:hypothetical protein [Candidatus Deianiraea vastatrix]QED23606.1 hypothetical protein Deia_00818 [Candidatus Deianiraea vastatrix]
MLGCVRYFIFTVKIHRFRKKKNGMYNLVQILIVLIITTLIVIMGAGALDYAFREYDVHVTVKQKNQLSESIITFKNSTGYWPGDVPANQLLGSMNTDEVNGLIAVLSGCTTPTCLAIGTNGLNMGTNTVSPLKVQLGFVELALGGFIEPMNIPQYAYTADIDLATNYSWLVHYYMVDKSASVFFLLDDTTNNYFIQSSVYDTSIVSNWSSAPRIIIAKAGLTTSLTGGIGVNGFLGGISANKAAAIDSKIDDGLPGSGNTVSDNVEALGGMGCTTVTYTTQPTATVQAAGRSAIASADYKNSNSTNDKQKCIMSMMVVTS